MGDDEDQLLFVDQLHPHEVGGPLHAGALGVDDGAAAGSLGAGRIHDGTGVALVGDDEQQLIAGIFQGALLLYGEGLVFGQELQGALAADAADRHDEGDAGAGHVDLQLAAQTLLEPGPGVGGDHGKEDGFLGLFQAEGGKRLLHGGAGADGAQADRDAELGIQSQKGVGGAAVGNGDQPVK